jgi:hypothetical protein
MKVANRLLASSIAAFAATVTVAQLVRQKLNVIIEEVIVLSTRREKRAMIDGVSK